MDAQRRTDPTTPRVLRLVALSPAAARPADAERRLPAFHERLTVVHGGAETLDALAAALQEPPADTVATLDGESPSALGALPLAGAQCAVIDAATLEARLAQTIVGALAELGRHAAALDRELATARARRDAAALDAASLGTQLDGLGADPLDGAERAVADDAAALADELAAIDAQLASTRSRAAILRELKKWRRVTEESRARLTQLRDASARVHAADLAEALRLRNEWQYAEQVHRALRRRRTRRDADERRARYEQFLADFGAATYEDLSVVGTGFGNSDADLAIREAATAVSMAEQRCLALERELAASEHTELLQRRALLVDAATALLGKPLGADPASELRSAAHDAGPRANSPRTEPENVEPGTVALLTAQRAGALEALERRTLEVQRLESERARVERMRSDLSHDSSDRFATLGPAAVEALFRSALDASVDDAVVAPVVVDRALSVPAPAARRRAFDVLVEHSRARQVILLTETRDVVAWARALGPGDARVWSVEERDDA